VQAGFPEAIACQKEYQEKLKMVCRYILDEHDKQLGGDIYGDKKGDPTGMPGEQAFVNGGDQGRHIQDEIDKPSFEKQLQEAHLDGEAIIKIAGKIVVVGLQP
jgi:hypothetical protein